MLPLLSLPIGTDSDDAMDEDGEYVYLRGVKRSRQKDRNASTVVHGIPSTQDQDTRAHNRDRTNWRTKVKEIWSGKKKQQMFSFVPISPDSDWQKRTYEVRAEITEGFIRRTTCRVIHDIYNFKPTGVHFVKPEELKQSLRVHYPDVSSDGYKQAFDTLPPGSATTADINVWGDALTVLPDWYWDFALWKKNIKTPASAQKDHDSRVARIDYPFSNLTYVGETNKGVREFNGLAKVPDGVGSILFKNGSYWNGRWTNGKPAHGEMGVFTDVDGSRTIGKWIPTQNFFKSATQVAYDELDYWNRNHHHTNVFSDRLVVEKPGYGRIAVASGRVGGVLRAASWHTVTAIARMFETTNPFELGMGRDVTKYVKPGMAYTKLIPLAVFDVDYSNSTVLQEWYQYQTIVKQTVENNKVGKIYPQDTEERPEREVVSDYNAETRVDRACPHAGYTNGNGSDVDSNLATLGVPLNTEMNEKFLLHATKPESLFAILNTSFDTTYASSGMLGRGIYFAEDPGKSDQYATPMPVDSEIGRRLGLNNSSILKILRKHAATPLRKEESMDDDDDAEMDHDVFFMFVARMSLGVIAEPDTLDSFFWNELPEIDWRSEVEPDKTPIQLFTDATMTADGRVRMGSVRNLQAPYGSLTMHDVLRYREFVVYANAIARVSQLVVYSRARQVELESFVPAVPGSLPTRVFSMFTRRLLLAEDETFEDFDDNEDGEDYSHIYSDPFAP